MIKEHKEILLETARETIQSHLENRSPKILDKVPKEFLEKKSCFVTLTKNGSLRGCIGSIQPTKSLWEAVQEKAIEAAFSDPRFSPLIKNELKEIKIEISVLTEPSPLEFGSSKELLEKLSPKKHGVILQKGFSSATFLPTVWEQIQDKKMFLSHLCMKAGLEPTAWQDKDIKIWIYTAESFST